MKNKFIKTLRLGLVCLMFSVLISIYTPQNNRITLTPISTHKPTINQIMDPPF